MLPASPDGRYHYFVTFESYPPDGGRSTGNAGHASTEPLRTHADVMKLQAGLSETARMMVAVTGVFPLSEPVINRATIGNGAPVVSRVIIPRERPSDQH